MLRKPLVIAAAAIALATPSPAFAMHGPGEPTARVPRSVEFRGSLGQVPLAAASGTSSSFSWLDAGIGALFTGGCVLLFVGGRLVIIRRHSTASI